MNFFLNISFLLLSFLLLTFNNANCQNKNKLVLNYQVEFGLSKLYNYPDEIYFQSGNNVNASLELQLKTDSLNFIGLQTTIGQVRYFADASIKDGRLVPSMPDVKQQDFGISFVKTNLTYERIITGRLSAQAAAGLIYYSSQTIRYKKHNSNNIIMEENRLKLLKPIFDLGLAYNLGGKPNLKLGCKAVLNPFSANFKNASPFDFNLFARFGVWRIK